MAEQDWYNNKQIFEMVRQISDNMTKITTELTSQISGLTADMKETRVLIKQYNGLREGVDEIKTKVDTHLAEERKEEAIERYNMEKYNSSRKESWSMKNWQLAVIGTIIGVLGIAVGLLW